MRTLTLVALLALSVAARASDLLELQPLTARVLLLHFKDGHVEHHKRGEPRANEKVIVDPLDTARASRPESYTLSSADDPAYATPKSPAAIARKSKGTEFAWFVDSWVDNHAVNHRPDHTKEHWITLDLPSPLQSGRTYSLRTGDLAKNGTLWKLCYDPAKCRSEAIHVNTLGYVPDAPEKFAYVYYWRGDTGELDVKPLIGSAFRIIDRKTGAEAFRGQVALRTSGPVEETGHPNDTPGKSFIGVAVAECDFSRFERPGDFVVSVEGAGCSWPFRIDTDVYRPAFVATARALYHNRSGIALTKPYTEFERPAPHNVKLTPGFAGKLRYTRLRWAEWGSEGGDAKKLMAESPGTLEDTWGWYQDAGDWDSYETHLRVAQELLLVYSMAPGHFRDGELNIPESGNGVPDILDEAAWLPRFCRRLRKELLAKKWGTGGIGLRVAGDAFGTDEGTRPDGTKVGRGSWEDTDRIYMVSGEDPWSTYRYAGVAANLARFITKDPQGVDWAKEARECYVWAAAHTLPGDEEKEDHHLREVRAYAAASLFALTGEKAYEDQLAASTAWAGDATNLANEGAMYGPAVYVLNGKGDLVLQARLRKCLLFGAEQNIVGMAARRALRWGGNYWMPMLGGQQTTPLILDGPVAYTLTRVSEPERAKRFLAALYTTCDYFLGTNPLNQTWITGVGPRYPTEAMHLDAWYNEKGRFHPGIVPYGPWRKAKETGQGPWDHDWANATVYPPIDRWPGAERWFSNRWSPMGGEFTIHQTIGPSAAMYGFLCADQPIGSLRPSFGK